MRDDKLIDIDAHMTDTKTFSFQNLDRVINAGEPLHDMWLRFSIDEQMIIVDVEAAMDGTPYPICRGVAVNFARLVGLKIAKGFLKSSLDRVRGTAGCSHLRDLLQQIGTVAMQTRYSMQVSDRKATSDGLNVRDRIDVSLLNSCYAYDDSGPVIAKYNSPVF